MSSITEQIEDPLRRVVLITAVVATALAAVGCGSGPAQRGGNDSPLIGNPLAPSPPISYALRGIVTDTAGVPLAGAKVAGYVGWGMTAYAFAPVLTAADGRFETPAIAGSVLVHVSKDGYSIERRKVTVSGSELEPFRLQRFAASTLVFTASSSCTGLPDEAKSRRYTVEVEAQERSLRVRVLDKEFVSWLADAGFAGTRDGDTVTVVLNDDSFGDWAFVELMGPGVEFALTGTATGTIGEAGIRMTFDGRVHVRPYSNPANTIAECTASDHRLEIVQ